MIETLIIGFCLQGQPGCPDLGKAYYQQYLQRYERGWKQEYPTLTKTLETASIFYVALKSRTVATPVNSTTSLFATIPTRTPIIGVRMEF